MSRFGQKLELWLASVMTGVLPFGAWAQTPEQEQRSHADRALIQSQRAAAESAFLREQSECERQFAVFDCLREARSKRRVMLDELRRQEVLLNDAQRQVKAMEALQRIQEKISDEQRAKVLQQEQQALQAQREREKRLDEKKSAPLAAEPGLSAVPKESHNPDSLLEQQRYQEKLQQARQHKLEKSSGGSQTGKPLPVPPGL